MHRKAKDTVILMDKTIHVLSFTLYNLRFII